jgi:hypothetical protein
MVFKYGQMALDMKDHGKMIKQREKENSYTLMETFSKVHRVLFICIGEWKDDKANGYGIYTHINGAKYEGNWQNDTQHGYGVESWPDGSYYEGTYSEGKKHGPGKYVWADGSEYNGDWVENKICGRVR